jgi:hypothetical protein
LLWSAILAVILYPLHLWLVVRLGNRWSALLIGMVGLAVTLVITGLLVTSVAASIISFISGLQNQSATIPPPPQWLADLPLVGQKLTETWTRDLLPLVVKPPSQPHMQFILGCVGLAWAVFSGSFAARNILGEADEDYKNTIPISQTADPLACRAHWVERWASLRFLPSRTHGRSTIRWTRIETRRDEG